MTTSAAAGSRAKRSALTWQLMIDANQVWEVDQAIDVGAAAGGVRTLVGSRSRRAPTTSWVTRKIRERHRARSGWRPASTCQNRIIFKQLLAGDAIDVVPDRRLPSRRRQRESSRCLLLAAKFGMPVCPHAGGVGLCEYVQHLSMFDYVVVSGEIERTRHRVRRSPARAFRRSVRRNRRGLPRARCARLQRADAAGIAECLRVPERRRVASPPRAAPGQGRRPGLTLRKP